MNPDFLNTTAGHFTLVMNPE
jgi:hypothetical protein